jgi:hypothetical protein
MDRQMLLSMIRQRPDEQMKLVDEPAGSRPGRRALRASHTLRTPLLLV